MEGRAYLVRGLPGRKTNSILESHLDCVYQGNYRERESNRSAR